MGEKFIIEEVETVSDTRPWICAMDHLDGVFSGRLRVKMLDYNSTDSVAPWKQHEYEDSIQFERALDPLGEIKLRIISFHSPATCLPLEASARSFQALFREYDVHPDFIATLAAFGRFPDPADGYTTAPAVYRRADTRSFEAWYRLQYVERNRRSQQTPWSIRHTGVYHQYDNATKSTLIVLINPCRDAALETIIFNPLSDYDHQVRDELMLNPLTIHRLLCETYLTNWSPRIRDQSEAQQEINDNIQTTDLSTGSLDNDFRLSQQLRRLKDLSVTNRILCQSNVAVLDELTHLFRHTSDSWHWLSTHKAQAQARCDSLQLLQDRIQNDIELLEHTATQRDSRINHRSQTAAAQLNETLLSLTYNTVDDSATIKIITILSLIFLPGSFIAAIFGMNFFDFNDGTPSLTPGGSSPDINRHVWEGLTVGHNFWVFVATWIPVTIFVLLVYFCVTRRRQKMLQKRKLAIKDEVEEV